jgi:hypothetical protein
MNTSKYIFYLANYFEKNLNFALIYRGPDFPAPWLEAGRNSHHSYVPIYLTPEFSLAKVRLS